MNGSPAYGRSAAWRRSGFTLVELLVVLLIIAALVLIALPRYFHAVYRSQVRGCQSQIEIISTATQAFFARNNQWPSTLEEMCESTAPSWVIAPPLPEVPLCPFGVPYELVPLLQDGSVGAAPTTGNPQVGVQVNVRDHFEGSWKNAETHVDVN
ncbi:MAG: prepilin-type N-terminal cleavage/methylation domain-containing protein [Armatimonadota bacterium]